MKKNTTALKAAVPAASQSSPLPWIAKQLLDHVTQAGGWVLIHASPKDRARMTRVDAKGEFTESDSALIVRRVNQGPAFDAMVEALEAVIPMLGCENAQEVRSEACAKARAALKMAQEVR